MVGAQIGSASGGERVGGTVSLSGVAGSLKTVDPELCGEVVPQMGAVVHVERLPAAPAVHFRAIGSSEETCDDDDLL
jgi:hypothetical protein